MYGKLYLCVDIQTYKAEIVAKNILFAGADPGFDQGGAQIVTGLKLPFWGLSFGAGASFLVVRGGPSPRGPPGSAPDLKH